MEAVPRDVDTVVFPNYESMPERDDVDDPFTELRAHCMSGHNFDHKRAGPSTRHVLGLSPLSDAKLPRLVEAAKYRYTATHNPSSSRQRNDMPQIHRGRACWRVGTYAGHGH